MISGAQILVKVDLNKLHANLTTLWRQRLTLQDMHDFLLRSGFRPVDEGWVTEEDRLMLLDPSEVISADPIG